MMYIGNVLSLGSYTYSSIGTDQQGINDEQRRRIVIGIWTLAGLERGWLHLNQFDPANLAHILKHNSLFLVIQPLIATLFEVAVFLAYSRTYSLLRQKKSLGRYSYAVAVSQDEVIRYISEMTPRKRTGYPHAERRS